MYAFNRVRVMSNPEWPLLFRARPESPPPRDGPGQNPQNLRATTPITHEEARSQIDALGSAAQKPEADLAVAKAVLHRPLTREKPAERSLVILSKSRYMTQADLQGARHTREIPPLTTRKRKSKNSTKEAPPGWADKDDREWAKATSFLQAVVSWRGRWIRLSGWGGEESTNEDEELQNREETAYERFPLAETSGNIRLSARRFASVSAAQGEQRMGRKGKGKGSNAGSS